ncbi:ammonium transporter [Glycomyces niveus]|jgi:Amt family ammonium transporter|uniref:Ammonium transporter n=1 Tax=Glycomyces niveus TaxID=2820287 RepID=A0ABS3U1M9_9ACTN|nr:ammonium transporter [Glycomyces sp. NEAU-S30]MBO3732688.1 ammonium transporter [Glycomyces sp. NEAU-S30]
MPELDTGSNAWILTSAALVLLMTPGLALFYGGLTRASSVLNMMMKCLVAIGVVSIAWVLVGESIAIGNTDPETGSAVTNSFFGDLSSSFGLDYLTDLAGVTAGVSNGALSAFGMMFAIITVALIAGAVADRMKFFSWVIFATVWVVVVYAPVAFWVWGGGWIEDWGVLDFAGGSAVHANAGAAGLALALVVGRRIGWKDGNFAPHNLPLVVIGTGLLWFGWFGFNAGSAFASNGTAGLALLNTQVATAAAILAWLIVDRIRGIKPSVLGACSGVIAGLVAITPAAGYVAPVGAIAIGAVAGIICPFAIGLKHKLGYDDALDVVGLHMVAGIWGSISVGLFAVSEVTVIAGVYDEGVDGLLYGGDASFLGKQAAAVLAVVAFSFIASLIIAFILKFTVGVRISEEEELAGIDAAQHGEAGYDLPLNGNTGTGLPETNAEAVEKLNA